MTIAIKRENGQMFYFDAVETYSQQYASQVTKHPIDKSGNISDHIFKDNATFSVKGVVSNVDFNTSRLFNTQTLMPKVVYTAGTGKVGSVIVSGGSTDKSGFLPDSISQFLSSEPPTVTFGSGAGFDHQDIIKRSLIDIRDNQEIVTLYEVERGELKNPHINLAITKVVFKETVGSGDLLEVDLDLEQVDFSYLRYTAVPEDVVAEFARLAAADKANLGDKSENPKLPERSMNDTKLLYDQQVLGKSTTIPGRVNEAINGN